MPNKIDFVDYLRIRSLVESHKQQPTAQITQYDDDKLTYKQAYDAFKYTLNSQAKYTDTNSMYTIDTIGFLVDTLREKNLLDDSDISKLTNLIKNEWSNNRND